MNQNFVDFMAPRVAHTMAVAVSGGADSVCLLHWLVAIGIRPTVLHVNHGLRDAADAEEQYVRDLCSRLDVPLHVFHWRENDAPTGIEAAARQFRYHAMTQFCRENGITDLLVAHHRDDQIETFLMNLSRGSGIIGLAGMRRIANRDGINIVRPLLDTSRDEIVRWCDANNVKYFHDEMNDDERYTRVKIRQHRHVLQDTLGISDERILLAMKNLARTRDMMERDVNFAVATVMDGGRALFSDSFLFDLRHDIRLQFIGTLIMKIGGGEYRPRLKSLENALHNLRTDCKFTLGRCVVRRLGARILIVPEGAKTSFRKRNERKIKTTEK